MKPITEKFKAWCADGAPSGQSESKVTPLSLARVGWMGYPNSHNPHGQLSLKYQATFIQQPDEKPKKRLRAKRRRQGQPVLVTIAEKTSGKLIRVVGTAEELLRK